MSSGKPTCPHAPRDPLPPPHRPPLSRPPLAQLVRLCGRAQLRARPRVRVLCGAERVGALRRFATAQVRGHRPRRGHAGGPGGDARRLRLSRRASPLHTLVRRGGETHRRRHGPAHGRGLLPHHRRRPVPALVPGLCAGDGRGRARHHARSRRARAPRAYLAGYSETAGDRHRHRRTPLFRADGGVRRRGPGHDFPHRLHRRPRVRDLDAPRARARRVGRPCGNGPRLRSCAGRARCARRGPHRGGAAAQGGGLRVELDGVDRIAQVVAVRGGAGVGGAAASGPGFRGQQGA